MSTPLEDPPNSGESPEVEAPRREKSERPSSLVSLLLLIFLGAVGYNLYFVAGSP